MAVTTKIITLYEDKEKTVAVAPRTKTEAISNSDGTGLDAIITDLVYFGNDRVDATVQLNADLLNGYSALDIINMSSGSGSVSIIIDNELNLTSENPVKNKIITAEINSMNNKIDEVSLDIEEALQDILGVGTVQALDEILGT